MLATTKYGCGQIQAKESEMTKRELLNVDEAAAYLGVSKWTIYSWYRAGEGPDRFRLGRCIRYSRSTLDAWMDANVEAPGPA